MKSFVTAAGFALMSSALVLLPLSYAQDAKKTDAPKAAAKDTAGKKDRAEPRGRVPNFYGQLGLSDEQKTKIYAIQEKTDAAVAPLQKQISDLRAKEDADINLILTDAQKKQLAELTDAAKKKRADTAKERAKKAEDGAKTAGDGDKK